MLGRLRALLRRLGIREPRWMPDGTARESHDALVRGRLPRDPAFNAGEPTTSAQGENTREPPGSSEAGSRTDEGLEP